MLMILFKSFKYMINQCRFICFLLVIFLLEGSNSLMAQEALGKINCICIDAGHGGKDPGPSVES